MKRFAVPVYRCAAVLVVHHEGPGFLRHLRKADAPVNNAGTAGTDADEIARGGAADLQVNFLRARHDQEQIYLDEIERRFKSLARVRVPQLPSDVHGVATLEQLAGILVAEKALH